MRVTIPNSKTGQAVIVGQRSSRPRKKINYKEADPEEFGDEDEKKAAEVADADDETTSVKVEVDEDALEAVEPEVVDVDSDEARTRCALELLGPAETNIREQRCHWTDYDNGAPCYFSYRNRCEGHEAEKKKTKFLNSLQTGKLSFVDLPAEIRLKIYKLVLSRKEVVSFGIRHNFAHSAALLRANRQVHLEASVVLYGETRFIFEACKSKEGRYFEEVWNWIGWRPVYDFLSTIGPRNTSLLRQVAIIFTDAAPTDLPGVESTYRKFYNDPHLKASLCLLAAHAHGLEVLRLEFSGRSQFYGCVVNPKCTEAAFHEVISLLRADFLTIGESSYPGPFRGIDEWVRDRGRHVHNWFPGPENRQRIVEGASKDLFEKIVRKEPLNPAAISRREKLIKEKQRREEIALLRSKCPVPQRRAFAPHHPAALNHVGMVFSTNGWASGASPNGSLSLPSP